MAANEQTQTAGAAAVARAYFDAIAKHDLAAMGACWEPGSPDVLHGLAELSAPAEIEAWFGALFAAFPDFALEVLDLVSEGEKAVVRWRGAGTFDGTAAFEGLRPNGSRVDIQGCDLLTVRGGRIVGNDAYLNGAEMMRQLGALPPAGSAPEKAITALLNAKTQASAWIASHRS